MVDAKTHTVARAVIGLEPGGAFTVVMASPEGAAFPEKQGCVLVVEPERRLVFTDGLGPLFRPDAEGFMTAEITMEAVSGGTLYRALVRHKNPRIGKSTRTWVSSRVRARASPSSRNLPGDSEQTEPCPRKPPSGGFFSASRVAPRGSAAERLPPAGGGGNGSPTVHGRKPRN